MTETNNLTTITTPEQAIREFVGSQYIVWLTDYITHEVANWAVLSTIRQARVESQKLRKFLMQLFLIQQALWSEKESEPGFLKFIIANLSESDDPSAEGALVVLQAKFGEQSADSLRVLWLRLFASLGLSAEELAHLEPKEVTRNYIAELSEVYSDSDWQIGLGALVSYCTLIGPKFQAILELCRHLESFAEKDFEIVKLFSSYPAQALNLSHELLETLSFDPANKDLVWAGVLRQLEIEKEFLEHTVKYLE